MKNNRKSILGEEINTIVIMSKYSFHQAENQEVRL